MHQVARLLLSLILIVQPSFCWVSGVCADSSNGAVSHNCCCGEDCPAAGIQLGNVVASCGCGADSASQPAQPSKPIKEWRVDGALFAVASLPAAAPAAALVMKPQAEQGFAINRSIHSILCVWQT
jgi:hypothetical protein